MNRAERERKIEKVLSLLSLKQKVGQLFLLAFPGDDPSAIFPLIKTYGIGGCYISQENATTFSEACRMNHRIQKEALKQNVELPLFLGVDQEGAWGVLVPESSIGPGNLALGSLNDKETTYRMYEIYAREMASVGYHTLGPCCDVNLNPLNPIIATRSFGQDPQLVALHAKAAVEGIRDAGGIATAKHFPGHGDTHADSHREIPSVNKSKADLKRQELLPFQAAIDAGVDILMTAHILFPSLDAENPATLSSAILTDLVRKEMGFQGLIMTDSMNMGAMRRHYSPGDATLRALKAGADIIMLAEEHYDHSAD